MSKLVRGKILRSMFSRIDSPVDKVRNLERRASDQYVLLEKGKQRANGAIFTHLVVGNVIINIRGCRRRGCGRQG
jgi:hypothetical protein